MIERDLQPFENVPSRLRFSKLELGPSANDLSPELDEIVEHLEQRQHLRTPADDREHDHAERRLQLRVLVEVVEDDLSHLAAFQVDDDPEAVPIGFVANVGDALEHLLPNELRDPLDQPRLVDLVGNSLDDDGGAVALFETSISALARMMTVPRPVRDACWTPCRPTM